MVLEQWQVKLHLLHNVVMGAVNAAKSALHIGSPSKLFKQYGVWTMEGLGIGINKEGKMLSLVWAIWLNQLQIHSILNSKFQIYKAT